MDKKPTVLDLLARTFTVFGITVLILCVMCALFGDLAKGFSEIFALGSSGLSVKTLLEFLLSSAVMNLLSSLFMTDAIIHSMSAIKRIALMFTSGIIAVIIFSTLFGWFPVNDLTSWIAFIICFVVCCSVGTLLSAIKLRAENRQLAEALEKLKEKNND